MQNKGDDCIKGIRQQDGAAVVSLAGEVDLNHTPAVHRVLVDTCEAKPDRLIIDLQDVSYLDSSGLGTLVEVFRRVKGYGGQLVICGLNDRVRSVFEITKLDHFFAIRSNLAEALAG